MLFLITIPTSGPCQFPTLGFVVSRYNQVKSFVPETFWYIYLALTRTDETTGEEEETPFTWRRGHLFEFEAALALYEHVLDNPMARVIKVTNKNTKKWCASLPCRLLSYRAVDPTGSLYHSPPLTSRRQVLAFSRYLRRKYLTYDSSLCPGICSVLDCMRIRSPNTSISKVSCRTLVQRRTNSTHSSTL